MSEHDIPVEGYANLFYDELTECYVIYLQDGGTFIEICGLRRLEIAKEIHDKYYPETPSDVKTIY